MSTTVSESATISGQGVQTIGGAMLALGIVLSVLAFVGGDLLTAVGVLLYVPVGVLLLAIGRKGDLV